MEWQKTEVGFRPLGQAELTWGASLHPEPRPRSQKDLAHLDDVVCRLVQAGAMELQAGCVVACLIAFFCHCLQGWQVGPTGLVRKAGALWSRKWVSHPQRHPAYPRVTESDPVLHPVPKGLKAQVGIITKVVGHAHILPSAIPDLEHLRTEEWRKADAPGTHFQKRLEPLGQVYGRNLGGHSYGGCLEGRGAELRGPGH